MSTGIKTSEDIISQIQALANDDNFSKEAIDGLTKIIESFTNQESIEATLAQRIGQYFYYYAQIDEILTKIVRSLLPELDLSIMGLDSSLERNSFLKKIDLIKSLAPNSDQLKIFSLLKKLNAVRNQFAHSQPDKMNLTKTNRELINVFKEAFVLGDDLLQKISNPKKVNDEISIPVKIILVTKMFLDLFVNIEILGKKEDKHLRLFESVRKFSSLYVRRRFSILAYQIQTRSKSKDAPDDFMQMDEFNSILEEVGSSIQNIFTSKK